MQNMQKNSFTNKNYKYLRKIAKNNLEKILNVVRNGISATGREKPKKIDFWSPRYRLESSPRHFDPQTIRIIDVVLV